MSLCLLFLYSESLSKRKITKIKHTHILDGIKLCDFGISRMVEEGNKVREIMGTPDYVAPEVCITRTMLLMTYIKHNVNRFFAI